MRPSLSLGRSPHLHDGQKSASQAQVEVLEASHFLKMAKPSLCPQKVAWGLGRGQSQGVCCEDSL